MAVNTDSSCFYFNYLFGARHGPVNEECNKEARVMTAII